MHGSCNKSKHKLMLKRHSESDMMQKACHYL
uniref:Uncharacterized protein n=1 Tax=Arundo donax TaxID=35708 RepID=A0A0A9G3F1_ARUDO